MPANNSLRPMLRSAGIDLLVAASTALLLWLAFAPIGQFYLAWVGLGPLLWRLHGITRTRHAALLGFVSGLCFFLLGFHWLFGATWPGYLVACVIMSLYWMLAATLVHRARRFGPVPFTLAAAATWTATEYLRGVILGGFPWLEIGHTQSPLVVLCQIADVTGVAGISAWVAMVNATIVCAIVRQRRAIPIVLATFAITGLIGGYGWLRMQLSLHESPPEIRIALVQSNFVHTASGERTVTQQQQIDYLLERSKSIKNVDLIAWPETMMPPLNIEARTEPGLGGAAFFNRTLGQLASLARDRDAAIVTGGYFVGGFEGELGKRRATDMRNSVYHVSRDGQLAGRYDKIRLVPFAEWLPGQGSGSRLHELMKKFATAAYASGYHLTPADQYTVFNVDGIRVVTPICFEDTIAPIVRRFIKPDTGAARKRADLILNISNDGWFNSFEKALHLQIATFRSIENRVPTARVSNTGQSAFIDSAGRITSSLPPLEEGVLQGRSTIDPRLTFYTRFGDVFAWVCVAVTAAAFAFTFKARQTGRTDPERPSQA